MTRRDLLKAAGSGMLATLAGGAYGLGSSEWLELEESELRLPKWDADGFRVGLFTDVHLMTPGAVSRAKRAIEMLMAAKPDVILFGGDFVDNQRSEPLRNLVETFGMLREASCPCFGVMGNHDYWSANPRKVIEAIKRTPMRLLRNEAAEVAGVTIGGADDAIAKRLDPSFLNSGRHSKSLLVLLHEPDFVQEMPELISLQLSGHSHGGQICLPFGFAVHTPKGARRYISGYYPNARVPLYVSRGIGTTGPDVRLFCRPEVSLLTLRQA